MGRPRLMTHAKGKGLFTEAPPVTPRDPGAPPIDRSLMGCARREAASVGSVMRGTVLEMQSLAAAINPAEDPQRIADALQRVAQAAMSAAVLAGRLRGINDMIRTFEEIP